MADVRAFLVTYDIASPKRWRKVYKALKRVGTRQQYSVFLCVLAARRAAALERALRSLIDPATDRLLFADLGEPARAARTSPSLELRPVGARIL